MKTTEFKKQLKKMSVKELQKTLIELEQQRRELETKMHHKEGSSILIRNYPTTKQIKAFGNLKNIKKDIARVKTYLNLKTL